MSTYRVAFSDTAEEGLLNIVDYIALDNPVRAVSFVGELTVSVRKMLSAFPYSGKVVEDLGFEQEVRVWPYGDYNSYYHVIEDKQLVEVLFVFHASRDVQALMAGL